MFGAIGTFVYRLRFAVIAVLIVVMGGLGLYGLGLGKNLSQSGFFDDTSQSVKGSQLADSTFGRDHKSDIVLLITPPAGTTVDNPEFGAKVEKFVDALITAHPTIVNRDDPGIIDPFAPATGPAALAAQSQIRAQTFDASKQHAFISIGVKGNDDTTILNNYKTIEPFFDDIPGRFDLQGTTFQLAGLQPVANAISDGVAKDTTRAELVALPLVALMLFFIFGGVVAAVLPVIIGGLTIAGATGILNGITQVTEVNFFAQPVISLIGLGIAIDYGLFIVSRFREELAEGYPPPLAVRRTVMTAGQTVVFSATIIIAALACVLIYPQGFLKSVAYGAIASVSLAAILSITVLPALLGILGPRVDAFSLRWMLSYTLFPIVRKFSPSGADRLDHRVADLTGRTKSREEIENGFWGRLSGWVMKHPVATAVPTVLLLLVLTIPFGGIKFGGISEQYLPPDNPSRVAQEAFDKYFPTERTEDIKLVIMYDENNSSAGNAISQIADEANKVPGFTKKFSSSADDGALTGSYGSSGLQVLQMSAGLVNRDTAGEAIKDLRKIDVPSGMRMWVAGTPALTQDSIDALLQRLPLMALMLVLITGLLMFLAFGSVVLPIKAALMSVLGLGATLGILTWIFVDGHGAGIANFTPGPLFAAVLVLIIAIVFGLSTDYEIFLLSRMVEARQRGASTTEAIRVGTALTGRIITAAAAILVVVTGAFGLSEIVMMKYIAYGMIAALILDATIIRMLLVPSVMKLLGDDCWWAPRWMRTLQRKIGLGEIILDEEPDDKRPDAIAPRAISAGTLVSEVPTSVMAAAPSAAGTRRRAGRATPQTVEPGGPRRPAAPASAAPPSAPNRARPQRVPTQKVPAQKVPTPPATARRGPSAPPSGDMPAPRMTTGPRPGTPRPVASAPADAPPAPPRRYSPNTQDRPDTGGWSLGEGGIRLSAPGPVAGATESPSAPNTSGAPSTSGAARSQPPSTPQPPSAPRPRTAPPATGRPQPGTQSQPGHRARPDLTRRPPTPPSGPPPGSASGPQPGPGSPLSRRPELDQTGQRPLAASLSPEERSRRSRPAPIEARPDRPSPMDRGLSQGSSRLVPPRSVSDPTTADPTTTADVPDPAAPGRAGPDRAGAPSADDPRASSPGRDRTASDRHARDTEDDDRISVHDLLRRSRSGQTGD